MRADAIDGVAKVEGNFVGLPEFDRVPSVEERAFKSSVASSAA